MNKQKGFTVFGLVVTVVLLVLVIILTMKIVPVFTEYRVINRVLHYAAIGRTEGEVKSRYVSQLRVEGLPNNQSLQPGDLKVQVSGTTTTISFEYTKEVPLIGSSVFLMFKFNDQVKVQSIN